jgi:hypothetical protein
VNRCIREQIKRADARVVSKGLCDEADEDLAARPPSGIGIKGEDSKIEDSKGNAESPLEVIPEYCMSTWNVRGETIQTEGRHPITSIAS